MTAKEKKLLLDAVVQDLRESYLAHRRLYLETVAPGEPSAKLHPKWDGGIDSRGVKHKGVWENLAKEAIDRELIPYDWISCLFEMAHLFDHTPWPTDLRNPLVMQRTRRLKQERQIDLRCGVQTETLILQRAVFESMNESPLLSRQEATRRALLSTVLEISPLTRYVRASSSGLADVAEAFEMRALAQYVSSPEVYQQIFNNKIPAKLLQLAGSSHSRELAYA
jgi:hypothetical protein